MDSLQRLEAKLDQVVGMVSDIKAALAGQTVQTSDHARRIEGLEKKSERHGDTLARIKGALALSAAFPVIIEVARYFLKG